MTKFETVGVQHQYNANTKHDALKSFMRSCDCCCNKGMRIDCDHCAIAETFRTMIAILDK